LAALDDADLVRVRVGEVGGFGGALARERDERDGRRGTGLDDGAGLRGESADAAAMGVMLDRLSGLSSERRRRRRGRHVPGGGAD